MENKKTNIENKEATLTSLWMRLGVSVAVTKEELEALQQDDYSLAREALMDLLRSGRCKVDGNTYFPENDAEPEKNIQSDFDFPLTTLTVRGDDHVPAAAASHEKGGVEGAKEVSILFRCCRQSAYTEPEYFDSAEDSREVVAVFESRDLAEAEKARLEAEETAERLAEEASEEDCDDRYYEIETRVVMGTNPAGELATAEAEKFVTYRIGFNGNDETEFDVEKGAKEDEMAELMELFVHFLNENHDIRDKFSGIDYVETAEE